MSDAAVVIRKIGWVGVFAGGVALAGFLAVGVRAQVPPTCDATRWAAVPTFTGSVSVNASANATAGDGSSLQLSESVQSGPNLNAAAGGSSYGWSGPMNGSVNFSLTTTDSLGQVTTIEGTGASLAPSGAPGQMYLSMDPFGCTYSLAFDSFVNAIATNPSGNTSSLLTAWIGSSVDAQPLPATGTTLSGSYSYTDNSIPGAPIAVTITWNLAPGTAKLDLVVRIPDYPNWIPTAGATEKDTGLTKQGQKNLLTIQAVLLNPDGTQSTVAPDKLVLQLVDASSEPGVSLNWPAAGSASSDPDLTFDLSRAVAGLPVPTLSQNDTVATFENVTGPPLLYVWVAPHDWGGWATLNVTATVGGLTLQGHFDGDPSTTDILLPKRNNVNSHIATAWLTQIGISTSQDDNSDAETSPSNSNDGDGLTLYEEYRGFAIKCPSPEAPAGPQCAGGVGHIYGDPKKKDLFVVVDPQLGGEVTPGILNFQSKTKLKVHFAGLTTDHVSNSNVINFNHGQGAHAVDQHAVLIKLTGAPVGCALNGPGTPMDVKEIRIPHLSTLVSVAQRIGRTPAQIAIYTRGYPQMTSHELGHAVDISHHGSGDPGAVMWYSPDGSLISENGNNVLVLTEQSALLDAAALGIQAGQSKSVYVGATSGQHGGDTKCMMRYGSSMAYIATANPTIRYYALENFGFSLTNTSTGTNTNASDHSPQPRYGDAAGGRGDCQSQLCVSDAVHAAPRQTQRQTTCP